MKRTALILGLMMTVFALGARAERETIRPLSLQECTRIALQHNFDIQIASLDPQLAEFSLSGSYGSYDPTLRFDATHRYNLDPGGLDDQFRPYNGRESETDNLGVNLGGLLPWGLNYNLGTSFYDNYGNLPVFNTNGVLIGRAPFENANASVGVFTMRQPLLKNFWIDSSRLQIFLNKKNVKYNELGLRNQIINSVTEVESAYYDLIYANENVKVQEKALELAERLVAENRRRVEVGALAPLDEKQAESQAASSRADLLAAKAGRDTAERVLKSRLSDDYNDWMDVRIEPTEALLALPQTLNLQDSWRKGLEQRPDLLQARITVEEQAMRVSYSKNQLYPQLDLVGSYAYSGSQEEISGAYSQIANQDNPAYMYGVSVSIPLANTSERNNYKSAKMTKEQLQLRLRKTEQGALILIENAMADARISYERVSVTHQATQYADDALKAEQTKLEKGKSTSFVVLQLQSNLTAARSAEIRALADYNINLAKLAKEEGSTLERRTIDLEFK